MSCAHSRRPSFTHQAIFASVLRSVWGSPSRTLLSLLHGWLKSARIAEDLRRVEPQRKGGDPSLSLQQLAL